MGAGFARVVWNERHEPFVVLCAVHNLVICAVCLRNSVYTMQNAAVQGPKTRHSNESETLTEQATPACCLSGEGTM